MGSCIFSEVTNIFLTEIEKTAVNIFHSPPTLWIRFVDDTFCVSNALVSESFMII